MMIPKPKQRKKAKSVWKKADKLFSESQRQRTPYCERCHKRTHLQSAHVFSRSHASTRYHRDNLVLCAGCHLYWWHKEPAEAIPWFQEAFPTRWDRLRAAQRVPMKRQAAAAAWLATHP